MTYLHYRAPFIGFVPFASAACAGAPVLAMLMTIAAVGQSASPPKDKGAVMDGFNVHQSFDLGGHVADNTGSTAMYDTLVNLRSGPRILNHTLEVHPVAESKHKLFDTLFEASTGYGGDPNDFSTLRVTKGKLYDLQGMFRRDRQYFDYNLLGNPLIPAGVVSNGYTYPQVLDAPHLFNTVRRMTDVNLTLLPLSKISYRAGYSQNINQGPSYSSYHEGADALFLQNWRNSSDTWIGGIDFKPIRRTTLTYEEHVVHYKGDTNWQLPNSLLPLQLANGAPVSIGFDNITPVGAISATTGCSVDAGKGAILTSATTPATANPCVNAYLGYTRYQPTRTLFPTEEFRFQSSTLKPIQMNGRFVYTDGTSKVPAFSEFFNGLESRVVSALPAHPTPTAYCTKATAAGVTTYNDCLSTATTTGFANAKRINTSASFGIVWDVSPIFTLSDQYDFQNFHQPTTGVLTEVDQYSSSMLAAPAVTGAPAVTAAANFLGQKMHTNTVTAAWQASPEAEFSLGYRYRVRDIAYIESVPTEDLTTGANYTQQIHENAALLGLSLRPTRELRINANVEASTNDGQFTQISPKLMQRYSVRATYRPKSWSTFSGSFNGIEKRNNVPNVNFLAHARNFSGAASLAPNEHYGLDLSYGYVDVFSQVTNCFVDTVAAAPADATIMPIGVACGNAINSATSTTAFYGTSYYDAPTQFGSAAIALSPIKQFHSSFGYRVSAVEGKTETLNPLEVPGSLQSKYQSPFANISWKLTRAWAFRADYNYYGYGEGGAVGPTTPRNFHGNIYTLGVHYEY